jgi:hypothetical protein
MVDFVNSGGPNQSIAAWRSRASLLVLSLAFLGCGQSKHSIGGGANDVPNGVPTAAGGSAGRPSTSTGGKGGKGGKGGSGGSGGSGVGNAGTLGEAGATGGTEHPLTDCGIPSSSQLPRLSNAQYDRTVRDLLGVTALSGMSSSAGAVAPSALLGADHDGALTDVDWASYLAVGQAIAAEVMADPTLEANFITCAPNALDTQCLHDSIVSFGRRAFRRPLTDGETARFDNIVAQAPTITADGTLSEVAEVVLETFLVSPSFLQRTELDSTRDTNGNILLSSWEVASRLSYLLWGSTPDAALDQVADANGLADKAGILAQAQRMLADPKAHDGVAAFHRAYLGLGLNSRWDQQQKDATKFPTFTKDAALAVTAEAERFFDTLVFTQGAGIADLFTSPLGFVNAASAPLYGLDPSAFGSDLTQVKLDPSQRPGFLTRAGFLAAFSSSDKTSPILRGAFIAKTVQGIELGAPPPGTNETPSTGNYQTNRERVDAVTASAACAGCHSIMNPPGYVLENYDAIGRWQTVEADTGATIDPVADVTIDGGAVHVKSSAELMQALAASEDVRKAYAKQWVNYAFQRSGDPNDQCTVESLANKLTQSGYRILDLIADLTQADAFRARVRE